MEVWRVTYLKFDVKGLPPMVLDVQLQLTGSASDSGSGMLRVFRGEGADWDASRHLHDRQ